MQTQLPENGCEVRNTEGDIDTLFYQLPLAKFLHSWSFLDT